MFGNIDTLPPCCGPATMFSVSSAADRPPRSPTYMLIPEATNHKGRNADAPCTIPAAPPSTCATPRHRPSKAKPAMMTKVVCMGCRLVSLPDVESLNFPAG
jgi:hypothetical protein